MHPFFYLIIQNGARQIKIGVVFFMTSEHLEDLPLPRGRGFSGPQEKIHFDSNLSQAFSVDRIISSSKALYRAIFPRKNV